MPRNKIIPYRRDLKLKARALRKNSTTSEVLLWCEIKNKQILGFQFHRQVPILNYIVNFYCHELMLAIEVDGETHYSEEATKYDIQRQKEIEAYGVVFLRFDDLEVKQELNNVVTLIYDFIDENHGSEN